MATDLEALGFSKEEIAERVIDRICSSILSTQTSDEDGYGYEIPSEFKRDLDRAVKARIDAEVTRIADKHITPRIGELIEGVSLQRTNEWGEAKGEPVTFTEYLVQRAEAYMTETVDYQGKSKKENGSFSFTGCGTRVAYMIDEYLHHSIETAMKQALADANATIAKGLNETVRNAINNLTVNVKTEVKSA